MLCRDGKVSLLCYTGTILAFVVIFILDFGLSSLINFNFYSFVAPGIFYIVTNAVVRFIYKEHDYQVGVRSTLLGFIYAMGLYIFMNSPEHVCIFGLYMCVMSFFHYTEFLFIAVIQPNELSTNSFLLYHSPQYVAAAVLSWIEFWIENYFFPGLKCFPVVTYLGLAICIAGEFLRKLAMLTASSNFNHLVQCTKSDDHVLVTHGIYSLFRHPSYVGWFYWSIGTQLILLNPFCIVGYTIASWFFFRERINIEEITLLNFFGQQYCDYQQDVGTGLPFINGYQIRP